VSISVRIGGTREILQAADGVQAGVTNRLRAVVSDTLPLIATRAREAVPVKSGATRATIRTAMRENGLFGTVMVGDGKMRRRLKGTNKRSQEAYWLRHYDRRYADPPRSWAPIVEFGDAKRNKPAEPFFFPSAEAERPAFVQRATAAINAAVESPQSVSASPDIERAA